MICHYNQFSRMLVGLIVGLSFVWSNGVHAEILVPIIPPNLVDVTVTVDTQFDSTTQLYTYTYAVTSLSTSQQNVATFSLAVDAEIQNIQSPQGWETIPATLTPMLMWAATEVPPEFIPPDFPEDGSLLPSFPIRN